MDESRREACRDLAALVCALLFVLGFGLGSFLVVFQMVGPAWWGPADQIVTPPVFLQIMAVFIACLVTGGFVGGIAWFVVMSRFLPKRTLHKWVTYGPQIGLLLRVNLKLLDALYD